MNPARGPERRDRLIQEQIHDTYRLRGKLTEPTRCPQCGVVYHNGHWQWSEAPPADADEHICSACHRANDGYPAGTVTISGEFAIAHKDEIRHLARNLESIEWREHPLNRIIDMQEGKDDIVIRTTDVHLPQRIGKALQRAYNGELDIHFDKDGYFTSVEWKRHA